MSGCPGGLCLLDDQFTTSVTVVLCTKGLELPVMVIATGARDGDGLTPKIDVLHVCARCNEDGVTVVCCVYACLDGGLAGRNIDSLLSLGDCGSKEKNQTDRRDTDASQAGQRPCLGATYWLRLSLSASARDP